MTIKYFMLIFCSLTLVSYTSSLQAESTRGNYNKNNATKVSQNSAEQDPKLKEAQTYFDRAVAKNKLNDTYGVLADLNQAVLINPRYSEAYNNRAFLKEDKLDDLQGAMSDYNQAISIDSKYSQAYGNRGILKYKKLNDLPGGIADIRQAAKLARAQGDSQILQTALKVLKELGVSE
jgi:tetratricopeptide (TPR) repeat protein